MSTTKSSKDRLGKLVGKYRALGRGLWFLVLGAIGAALGILSYVNAVSLSRALFDAEDLQQAYRVLGWILIGCGALGGLFGAFLAGESLEFRRKGLRQRGWLSRREMLWDEMDEIFVEKTVRL